MNTQGPRTAHWVRETDEAVARLKALSSAHDERVERARRAAIIIREMGGYRWVGLYDVTEARIAVIAWDGPEPPQFPSFPIEQGLNGAAVSGRRIVVTADVAADARHLPTISGTRSEIIVPAFDAQRRVIGTIDVESAVRDAFCVRDEERLAACAEALAWLWRSP
jgi:GAF domain-containing protein